MYHIKQNNLCDQIMLLFSYVLSYKTNSTFDICPDIFLSSICAKYVNMDKIINIDDLLKLMTDEYVPCEYDYLLTKAEYGMSTNIKDVTTIVQNLIIDNTLHISKNMNINNLFGDPMPSVIKLLKIQYQKKRNGKFKEIVVSENGSYLRNEILITKIRKDSKFCAHLNNLSFFNVHVKFQNFAIRNFKFSQNIIDKSNEFLAKEAINRNTKINMVVENDAIEYWAKNNKIDYVEFKAIIIENYKKYIHEYFEKENKVIVLAHEIKNEIIEYLRENCYNYSIIAPDEDIDEYCNIAIGIQIGTICNNVFLGSNVSSLSQLLFKKISNATTILLNYECATNEPVIISHEI